MRDAWLQINMAYHSSDHRTYNYLKTPMREWEGVESGVECPSEPDSATVLRETFDDSSAVDGKEVHLLLEWPRAPCCPGVSR